MEQNHIYEVIFTGVYSNNTLQFQLPMDSIFYITRGCKNYQLQADLSADQPNGAVLRAGSTLNVTPGATNVSSATSGFYELSLIATNGVPSANIPTPPAGPWINQGPVLPGRYDPGPTIALTIPANAPENSKFCLQSEVNPSNAAGSPDFSGQLCYTVAHVYEPSFIGTSGDVHAGGNLCVGSLVGACGSCVAHPLQGVQGNGGSYGEYVVSGTGFVTNVGSNNAPINAQASVNSYSTICRPDLVAKAIAYPAKIIKPSGALNISALAAGVYLVNGNVTISGTVNNKVTIFVSSGTATLGNITYSAGTNLGKDQPSLGIIAAGAVYIPNTTTEVDAYVFSNNFINTCYLPGVNPSATYDARCANTLTVKGFLMAQTVNFYRYGVQGSAPLGGPITAEIVNLTPQIYINPPTLFEGGIDQSLLNDIGERPPLN